MSANFIDTLNTYRQAIDEALEQYFSSPTAHLDLKLGKYDEYALERLIEFSRRPGKRIRGALAIFAYERLSDKQNKSIINLAVAIELIQNYLLIVDDVMDSSSARRGKPTVHKLFAKDYGASEHEANMLAINTALIAQHMASYLLGEVKEDSAHVNKALNLFHRNIAATCYGQLDDLFNHMHEPDTSELMHMYEFKNSYYTFINPLQVGAVLAGHDDETTLEQIARIGRPAGIAFQLHDDLLGVLGDEEATGKSNMDDVREGKRTLLMRYTMERASSEDRKFLASALGNGNLTREMNVKVQQIITASGAEKLVAGKAKELCEKAKSEVEKADFFDESAKQFLRELIDFVVNRKG